MKKNLFLFVFLFCASIYAQTTLNAGDIGFIGFHADNQDGFSFILLRDLEENTVIYFTEEGWNGSNSTWYNNNEGHYSWTVPSGGLSFETIVYIAETSTANVLSATSGNISSLLEGANWALSSSGDQVLAYQSSSGARPSSPTFIAAADADYYASYDGADGWTISYNVNTISYASYLPPDLINGTSCVALANASQTTEYDNFKYTGTLTGTASDVRTAINTYSNWTGNNSTIDISVSAYSTPNMTDPLPVELILFTATLVDNNVKLNWETATEVNNYGFEVERTSTTLSIPSESREWSKIGFVEGHGNSNSPKVYEFIDENVPTEQLEYRLKQIDTDGAFEYYNITAKVDASSVTDVEENSLPTKFALEQNYPNPFNPTTKISYSIPQNGTVQIKVYDMLGNEIRTLVSEQKQSGAYLVEFNASNLSSGIYLYKIVSGNYFETKKMVLLR